MSGFGSRKPALSLGPCTCDKDQMQQVFESLWWILKCRMFGKYRLPPAACLAREVQMWGSHHRDGVWVALTARAEPLQYGATLASYRDWMINKAADWSSSNYCVQSDRFPSQNCFKFRALPSKIALRLCLAFQTDSMIAADKGNVGYRWHVLYLPSKTFGDFALGRSAAFAWISTFKLTEQVCESRTYPAEER